MIRAVSFCIAFLALFGCTRTVYVDRHTINYVVMDDAWIQPTVTVKPPAKELYRFATDRQKLDMWTQVYLDQLNENAKVDARLLKARNYNDKNRNIVIVLCDGKPCK